MSVTPSAYKRCLIRLSLQLFVGELVSYLRYLCLFACSDVQHMVLCFCFDFLRIVYPMLPVSLDCQFLIAPSVSSNIIYKNTRMFVGKKGEDVLSCKTDPIVMFWTIKKQCIFKQKKVDCCC